VVGSNNIIKLKYILELTNYFFLSRIGKVDKTLTHHPWPALLQRLQWVGWAKSPSPCHFIGKRHTMVNVFVGWLTVLVSRQS
jgi:hypothetical protein